MLDFLLKRKLHEVEDGVLRIRKDLVTLIIMDGLGVHPDPLGNAVLQAKTPFLDTVWTKAHSTLIHASGIHVGLPENEIGNSEVGHLNLGAGHVVYQSLPRINDAIRNGTFADNPVLKEAFNRAKQEGVNLHLMGILSDGGVHGHINHLFALLDICKTNGISPCIHVFLDGRDTGLNKGKGFVEKLMKQTEKLGIGKIASISGRLYAMDRDKRWERTQLTYNAMIGKGKRTATDPLEAVEKGYNNDEDDQIFLPTTILDRENEPIGPVQSGDVVIFYNYREDRARQITKAFVLEGLEFIEQSKEAKDLYFVTMTGYEDNLPTKVVFPPEKIKQSLAHCLAEKRRKQFHISETEKYMHVTYFFNGGIEEPHEGEDFFNVPSPRVFDYSETPQMSAGTVTEEVVYRLKHNKSFDYSFILINYANPDMLGHTGNLEQAIKAVAYVDFCVKQVAQATLDAGGCVMILADHGNCETMIDRVTGEINTFHTNNPVPYIIVDSKDQCENVKGEALMRLGQGKTTPISGVLADIAPTILAVLGIKPPESMTGLNLLNVL